MLTFYSLGDINFLYQVVLGLHMVFGASDFLAMVTVAALFGAVLVIFQSVAAGGFYIDVPRLFAGWLLYSIAFVPQTDVVIESAYTGAAMGPVPVPVGVAYAGAVISEVGLRMTELFETAFSAPPMSQTGFASALETIKKVRLNTLSLLQWGSANAPVAGSDVHQSWVNYFKECTIPGVLRGTININQMMQAPSFISAVELNSPVNMARIYIGAGPQDLDCATAWTQLSAFTTSMFLPALEDVLSNVIPGGPVMTAIGTALSGLGLSSVNPQDFLLSSVLVPVYLEASAADAEETYKFSYAKEVSDAIRARNSEWMASQSIFDSYVSPVLTFIEGFEYAVTPLLVLLLVGGAPVAGIAGKYLYLLVWIQLWYPCMSIVNLYLYDVVTAKLAALAGNGSPLSSLAGVMLGDNVVATWLATGGMLAAAVPELSLLLVAGGSVVANSFVNHLGRTNTIDPTVAAPREVGHQFSFASFAPLMTYDPTLGPRATGAERVLPEFRFGRDSTQQVESAHSRMASSLAEFRSALANMASTTAGHDARGGRTEAINHSTSAAHGEVYQTASQRMANVADAIAHDYGVSRDQALQWGIETALWGQAEFGKGVSGTAQGKGAAGISDTTHLTDAQRTAIEQRFAQAFQQDQTLRDDLTRAAARDVRESREDSYFNSDALRSEQTVQRAAANAFSATETWQASVRQSESMGVAQSIPAQAAVQAVVNNPQAMDQLGREIMHYRLAGSARNFEIGQPGLERQFGSRGGAQVYAGLAALAGLAGNSEGALPSEFEREMYQGGLNRVLSLALPTGFAAPVGAADNRGLTTRALSSPAAGLSPRTMSLGQAANDGIRKAGADVASGDPTATFAANRQASQEQATEAARPVAETLVGMDTQQTRRDLAPRLPERVQNFFSSLGEDVSHIGDAFFASSRAAHVAEASGFAIDHGITPAQAGYYGLAAVIGDGFERTDPWSVTRVPVAERPLLVKAEAAVRQEAVAHNVDPEKVVQRLRQAAVGSGNTNAARILENLARSDQLNGMTGSMPEPLVQAVRRMGSGSQ